MKKTGILRAVAGAAVVASLMCALPASAADFSVHGYYRLRVTGNDNLDLFKDSSNPSPAAENNRFGFLQYNQMRLRLQPVFKLNDNISLQAEFDVLDNVLFGTQQARSLNIIAPVYGEQSLPDGGGSFWMTGPNAVGENGAINVRRVWADILTPIGKFRIGRQPSNWGLGIFQNDGEELQGDFGDTADRILYLLQAGVTDSGSVTGGILWDIAYEAQWDPRISGLLNAPPPNRHDTQRYAGLVMYEQPEFTVGVFGGLQHRNGPNGATTMTALPVDNTTSSGLGAAVPAGIDGDTNVYFADLYARYEWENYKFGLEGVYIGGKITTGLALDAIPFRGLPNGGGIINLPANQTMQALMAAFEASAHYSFGGEWAFKSGYASGDGSPLSQKITQFGFRPDYQIALMMFHLPMGSSPVLYGDSAGTTTPAKLGGAQPVTGNYINNALYISAGYKHKFDLVGSDWADWVKVGLTATTAWAPQKNTNVSFTELTGTPNLPSLTETTSSMFSRWYGVELDVSGEAQLWDHLYAALEGGVLIPGKAYDVDVQVFDTGNIITPPPFQKATIAWMIRLSTIVQF